MALILFIQYSEPRNIYQILSVSMDIASTAPTYMLHDLYLDAKINGSTAYSGGK